MQKPIDQILSLLRQYRRRMLANDILTWGQNYLWIAGLAMLVIQLIGRIWPVNNLDLILLIPLAVFLPVATAYLILIPKSDLSVAWRVDQNLHLKERISTVVALETNPPQLLPDSEALIEKQREDAVKTLRNTNPRSSFTFIPSTQRLLSTAVIFAAAIALVFIHNPMDTILKSRAAVSAAAEVQAEEIEALIEEIEADQQMTEETREALLQELQALAAQLRENQGDKVDALENISRLEQTLSERLDPDAQFRQAALASISRQLAALAEKSPGASEDSADLEESLESLANQIGEMSEGERQQLALDLQRIAGQAAQAGAASLSEALLALSQAAQTGSIEGAQQAAGQTQQILSDQQTQESDQQNLEAVLAQLQDSRQALSQAGQQGASAAQNPGGQPGQGQNPSQGQGQGQGSAAGGGGSNANNLPPGTSSGQAGTPQGTDSSGTAGTLADQVFAPWERLRGETDPLSISGQDTGQGQTQVNEQDQPLPGANNPSIVPYQEIFQIYQNTAYETIEESYIPPSLKTYVLEYFSQLEP